MSSSTWIEAVRQAASLDLDAVPAAVVQHACRVVADTVGVSIAGHRSEPMRRLVAGDDLLGSADVDRHGSATVLAVGRPRTAPGPAAYLNATAGSFLELDEGMRPTGHPAMQCVTAALAAAETVHASGAELIAAVLSGYEVTARLFRAYRLTYPLHPHGHFGAVGGAVAVARLTGTDPVHAAVIAGTSPILSLWPACYDGATARNTWMGQAAHAAVAATRLARAGFQGSAQSLDVAFGEFVGTLVDATALTAPLDYGALAITSNYFKIHSACALTHAALDAALDLDIPDSHDVTDVRVETVNNNMKLNRMAEPNSLSTRFSLPYSVATALLHRRTRPEDFEFDPAVAEFAERVHLEVAPDLEELWPAASPVRLTVTTAAGTTRTCQVDNPRGHHSRPLVEAELYEKFAANVGDEADDLWGRLGRLREMSDCAELWGGLAQRTSASQ